MPKISVSKEEALDLLYENQVLETVLDVSRWSVHKRAVVEKDGKFYEMYFSVGATEMQDEGPFDYAGDEVTLTEVELQVVERKEYLPVK